MRTRIKAAYDDEFGDLINLAYNAGYDLQVSDDLQMTLKATKDSTYMPKITVETVEETDGIYFVPTLKFPELSGWNLNYSDDIEYYIGCWQDIAKFITQLMDFQYDSNVYE